MLLQLSPLYIITKPVQKVYGGKVYHILRRIAMYQNVRQCTVMYSYVQQCTAIYSNVRQRERPKTVRLGGGEEGMGETRFSNRLGARGEWRQNLDLRLSRFFV